MAPLTTEEFLERVKHLYEYPEMRTGDDQVRLDGPGGMWTVRTHKNNRGYWNTTLRGPAGVTIHSLQGLVRHLETAAASVEAPPIDVMDISSGLYSPPALEMLDMSSPTAAADVGMTLLPLETTRHMTPGTNLEEAQREVGRQRNSEMDSLLDERCGLEDPGSSGEDVSGPSIPSTHQRVYAALVMQRMVRLRRFRRAIAHAADLRRQLQSTMGTARGLQETFQGSDDSMNAFHMEHPYVCFPRPGVNTCDSPVDNPLTVVTLTTDLTRADVRAYATTVMSRWGSRTKEYDAARGTLKDQHAPIIRGFMPLPVTARTVVIGTRTFCVVPTPMRISREHYKCLRVRVT